MTNLTEMETACILVMGKEGELCVGASCAADMIDDNMSLAAIEDFPFDSKIARGVLSSLIKKGLAVHEPRMPDDTDLFFLSDDGIVAYWNERAGA